MRRYILGDGLRPDLDGDYGCSGTGATHCVETTWLDLAGAVAAFARARCEAAPDAPALAAYERARAVSEREMEAMTSALQRYSARPGERTEARLRAAEARAQGANERTAERAGDALRACGAGRRYEAFADWLPTRDTDAIPRWPSLR